MATTGPAFHLPLPGAGYLRSNRKVLAGITEFISNEKRYNELPADLKEIIKVAAQASYWVHFVRWQIQTEKACQELIKSGVKIIKTSDGQDR